MYGFPCLEGLVFLSTKSFHFPLITYFYKEIYLGS